MSAYRIKLVNMPFAALNLPSFALTQMSSVLADQFGDRCSVATLYLNQDFARLVGSEAYTQLARSTDAHNSGIGEWLFRQVAFPELEDNTDAYLQRYYPGQAPEVERLIRAVLDVRRELDSVMDQLIETYGLDEADLVGFTSMFSQNVGSIAMARKLKARNPDLVTVIGGANCETPMGEAIVTHVPAVDFLFSGPALASFPEFVRCQLEGAADRCHQIPGVYSEENCRPGASKLAGSLGAELDLDTEIPLEYDGFLESLEKNFPGEDMSPKLFFETSRGCWWGERAHCTFCGLNGTRMNYRAMSPERALAQFDALFRYAGRCTELQCVDNIMPREYLQEVLPSLEPRPGTPIFYEVKADLSDEDLELLSNAGVKRLQPGIEALSTKTLKLMKKGMTAFRSVEFLRGCLKYDIEPTWNLLVGFPGEPEEGYEKYVRDIPLLTHLQPPTGAFPVRFDRYSPYFMRPQEYGLDLRPCDFYELIYPFEPAVLEQIAYYFMNHDVEAEYFTAMVRWIGKIRVEVDRWRQLWQPGSGLATPKLHFRAGEASNEIHDSRSGKLVVHRVSPAAKHVLGLLERRKPVATVIAESPALQAADVERELAWLQERGLLFEERGQLMSLVFDGDPRPEAGQALPAPDLIPISRVARRRANADPSATRGRG